MANLSKDFQCAGSDTRPLMLDRTDFASWKQCIRLYCRGKVNGFNILKSIDEGPFQMGTFRETLAEGEEGALYLDSAHMMAASMVPMLKPSEFEIWRMRIKQYIQMIDYALWDVLKNGCTLPKHKLWKLMEAIEKRFDGNAAIKKTQRNLLKQQYENFIASNLEMLDQTFDRLQKLVYEPEVKGMSRSNPSIQNITFVSSSNNNNTNRAVNTAQAVNTALGVSTAGTQVNTANIDNLSDVVIYTFPAGQPSSLQSVEERLVLFKKNEFIYLEDIKVLKVKIQMKDIAIKELRLKLEVAQEEKEGIQLTVEKHKNASKSLNKLIDCQIVDNRKKGIGCKSYNAVPPPYIGNFMLLKPNLSYIGLNEFDVKHVVENKSSKEETKAVRKNPNAPIVEE
nr:ribonuclease H-like domain-containing protein [Tanacetum cinerariifolium]